MTESAYLIVQPKQKPPECLPGLLRELSQKYQLDIYQSRQRLIGRELSLLTKGPAERLKAISPLLLEAGYRHWLVNPSQPGFVPQRVLNLRIQSDGLVFG